MNAPLYNLDYSPLEQGLKTNLCLCTSVREKLFWVCTWKKRQLWIEKGFHHQQQITDHISVSVQFPFYLNTWCKFLLNQRETRNFAYCMLKTSKNRRFRRKNAPFAAHYEITIWIWNCMGIVVLHGMLFCGPVDYQNHKQYCILALVVSVHGWFIVQLTGF